MGGEVTALLERSRRGDPAALDEVFVLLYAELKTVAKRQLPQGACTLSPTVLVHEVYVKLVGAESVEAGDRSHFLALAARAMRQLLVDRARRRGAARRGGGVAAEEYSDDAGALAERPEDLIAVDAALSRLEALDPRLAKVVEWRFFGGLSEAEIAAALGLTERTVRRDWRKARAFLFREVGHR